MERLIGILHLCRKAGKLILGQKAVLNHLSRGRQPLILTALDAGAVLRKKLTGYRTITMRWSSDKMGGIFGRERISVIGIMDEDFASEITNLIESEKLSAV
jgi:ribosomal protein L7Ae-like RNA K-turn-binding protein